MQLIKSETTQYCKDQDVLWRKGPLMYIMCVSVCVPVPPDSFHPRRLWFFQLLFRNFLTDLHMGKAPTQNSIIFALLRKEWEMSIDIM